MTRRGRLLAGTSGFAYPGWEPRFYAVGTPRDSLLRAYAERLPTVELNNTFYRQPRADNVASWVASVPASFRFVVKAQRGGAVRAFGPAATQTLAWLTVPYRLFGERLGSVLFRVPGSLARDDARLATLLAAWPAELPLTVELQHPSWQADEVFALLRAHGAALCATDLDDAPAPDLRLTGGHVYLRLRRATYTEAELAAWADRLAPFLDAGNDCYVFLRHDADGTSALRALALLERLGGDRQA
ncbi:MAG TPA: DUF72 domain-containing protein [Candidatus Limnocylindrales bacterium]